MQLGVKVYIWLFNSHIKFHSKNCTPCWNINKSRRGEGGNCFVHPVYLVERVVSFCDRLTVVYSHRLSMLSFITIALLIFLWHSSLLWVYPPASCHVWLNCHCLPVIRFVTMHTEARIVCRPTRGPKRIEVMSVERYRAPMHFVQFGSTTENFSEIQDGFFEQNCWELTGTKGHLKFSGVERSPLLAAMAPRSLCLVVKVDYFQWQRYHLNPFK